MVRRGRFVAAVIVVTALIGGCAYDWSFPGGVDPSLDGGGPGEGSKETSTNESSSPPDQFTPDSPIPTGTCKLSTECKAGEYCNFADDMCGAGALGKCAPIENTGACTVNRTVCACSKQVYNNSCEATKAGDDLSVNAPCPPGVYFRCGVELCKPGSDLCIVSSKGTTCATSTCEQPSDHKCGSGCSDIQSRIDSGCTCSENGGTPNAITLTCP